MTNQAAPSSESFEIVVEVPRGSRNKYEIDHETGAVWLDRYLYGTTVYPTEYGFFPDTLAEDGDPLDALVILKEPTVPGCHINIRPVGVLEMSDEAGRDIKILCVPANDHRWDHYQDITDVPEHFRDEVQHFFKVYKDLEPGKESELGEWSGRDEALKAIQDSFDRYPG